MKKRIKREKTEIVMDLIPIEEDGFHIFIPVRVNGKKARFLVDTGASRSVVDKDRILKYLSGEEVTFEKMEKLSTGLGTNTMESNSILLKRISFGREKILNYRAVALDLTHVNQSYQLLGIRNIDGVLGGDLLSRLNAIINYNKKVLTIRVN